MCVQSVIDIGLGNPIGPVRPREAKRPRRVAMVKPPVDITGVTMDSKWAMYWAARELPSTKADRKALAELVRDAKK